eukprot:5349251-Amphidinium_carterae.1
MFNDVHYWRPDPQHATPPSEVEPKELLTRTSERPLVASPQQHAGAGARHFHGAKHAGYGR